MNTLSFHFEYLGVNYHIEVIQPFGGGGSYHVFQNRYYIGAIAQYQPEGLTPVIQNQTVLTGDDIGVIMDIIEGRGY